MKYLIMILTMALPFIGHAQSTTTPVQAPLKSDTVKIDTVVIEVGKSSILFIIRDKKDLQKLQSYDLNKIVDELHLRLDPSTASAVMVDTDTLPEPQAQAEPEIKKEKPKGVRHYFNMDLGFNNYLSPDGFPDESNAPYTVRPWGSWYIALGSVNEAYLSRGVSLQFGANISWYNFKFQNDAIFMNRGDEAVEFLENPDMLDASFKKSKLTVAYINASLVPMFHFGKRNYNGWQVWNNHSHSGFRMGLGGYAGYRIGSYNKVKYNDGKTQKPKDHDSFYLENFRYGLRLQLGFGDTDVFVNYDLNTLFKENRGPELNALSFGIIF